MKIHIRRIMTDSKQTIGTCCLDLGEEIIPIGVTLELPWKYNAPNISCIPHGYYKAFRRGASKGKTGGIGLAYELRVDGRSAILIHVGNTTDETEGCILVGTSYYSNTDGSVEIRQSRKAYSELMGLTSAAEILYVDIREAY